MSLSKTKVAFIHRYGLEGWVCCGGHTVPEITNKLSTSTEIHFYGPRTTETKNTKLRSTLRIHELPYTWNRANPADKITKTLLWYFWLPIIGLRCRLGGIKLIWNDETVPFTAPVLRLFFGKNVVITVMDFFVRIYTEKHPHLRWLGNLAERIDFMAWKRLPIIFTKVLYTQEYLARYGVPKTTMHLYRNPVDPTIFHPVDAETRLTTRKKFGFTDDDIVLSHHGILHPNKGNNWILKRLEELKDELPKLKYLLIGNGPEMANLKRLSNKLGLTDRIVFTGWLPSEKELNEALASSDIGLVMRIGQKTDHFHMTDTLAHEMACGKPILAVNLKGIAETIRDGENGFLFSPEAPEEFRSKLLRLAAKSDSRELFAGNALQYSLEVSKLELCSQQVAGPLARLAGMPPKQQFKSDGMLFYVLTTLKRYANGLERQIRYSFPSPKISISPKDLADRAGYTYKPMGSMEEYCLDIPKYIESRMRYRFEQINRGRIPERYVLELKDGRVFGEGHVITADNRLVRDVSVYFGLHENHWLLGIGKLPAPVQIKGTVAVLDSTGSNNYFHWTLDTLPRFDLLREYLQKIDWFYIRNTTPFQQAWIKKLGIPPEKILSISPWTHIQADRLLVPSLSHQLGFYTHAAYDFIRRFQQPLATPTARKIYISRSTARRRRVVNETVILPFLAEQGYEVHSLSGMTVDAQMKLFSSASHIISAHGAEMTNLIYCRPGTKVLEIFSPYYINLCFWIVAAQRQLDYSCMLGIGGKRLLERKKFSHHVWRNIRINPEQFRKRLESLLT